MQRKNEPIKVVKRTNGKHSYTSTGTIIAKAYYAKSVDHTFNTIKKYM
jgi:hypothetical protein